MLRLVYLYKNLTRNVLRTLLTCAAVALPIVIYVLSAAVINGIDEFLDNSAKQLRLVVTHRASVISPLPAGYRAKIESLDPTGKRILSVCGMRWVGGRRENDSRILSTMAAQPDTFPYTFADYQLTEEEVAAWNRDRQAIIVGRATAGQFGWNVGDRITMIPSVPPYTPVEFRVVSTAPLAPDPITNFCRLDYFEEVVRSVIPPEGWKTDEWVSFIFVKCASKEDLDYFRQAIDALFARTPDETKTQDEKAFVTEYVNQQFNLPRNLTILAAVTVFVAIMAAANTMSMNLRDRLNELATLKSLGFSGRTLFALVQTEGLILCGIGGLLGALTPYVAFTHTPLRDFQVPLIVHLDVRPIVCAQAVGIALLIGVVAAVWPSWSAYRLPVVSALRNLE